MLPDLIDTHAHLDMAPLAVEVDGVLERAAAAGVRQVITIGIDLASSQEAVRIAERHEGVWAAVGIHPHDAKAASEADFKALARLATGDKVVAWGEIGLDFAKEYSPRATQVEAFVAQIEYARQAGLPIIIHDREAHDELVPILTTEVPKGLRGVVHCYSGDAALARTLLDLGLFISITGVVTFPKAETLREAVRFIPLDRLLLETDCPFLSPVPFRGKPNEPARVVHVAEEVARIKGTSLEEVARCTSVNARGLFGIPRP